MRHIPDSERRARLGRRHALAPGHRATDAEAATRAVTVLHATEPATVHLSLRARVDDLTVADVQRALEADRTLVKQLAMRRTLFVFPRDLLPAAWGSASARVAEAERKRMAKDVEKAGVAADGLAWVDDARVQVLAAIEASPDGLTAVEVREAVPEVARKFDVSAGSVWNHGRLLTHLGLTADVVRGVNTQHWRLSRPRWTRMERWLGEAPVPLESDDGYAEIVARWLRSSGPLTEDDLVWWLGGTKAAVRAALTRLEAVEVSLDGPLTGWVLPDDLEPEPVLEPWAALLPVLDPTVMGWKHRDFYLGPHAAQLFDRNGNAGTTAWWDGRVVGCWVQDDAGVVEVRLLERLPRAGVRALAAEAERLTSWMGGVRVGTVYPSAAMKVVEWVHP
ncbi:winged helix DNA-binding domain-containing protein [Nocardioides flavescens]|uniref:Winged helix DNA-binding domain-containing protein n=1 Tax=Nocardioides flavescens TaxID=2691959 RepID=A0A6L7EX43_9ACTN|nr:winged helix DNA-binding domain-containing protein [Nocardioides flavescens]MXG88201.1 winged helix DNA-binding domain-containing protein [Nocardioides flavescens]